MAEQFTPTQFKRIEQFKDRWTAYGANTGIIELSEMLSPKALKKYDLFKPYDDAFLEKISPDISIARWEEGATLFEEGAYIDLAFYILSGEVKVFIQKQQKKSQGRPIFDALRTTFFAPSQFKVPEEGNGEEASSETVFQTKIGQQLGSETGLTFLATMDFNLAYGSEKKLGKGEIFGEIGALVGWPQSVTAQAAGECELIQIRMSALRLMKTKSPDLKERIDKHYRETSLLSQLESTPLFRGCDRDFLDALKDRVELVSHKPDGVIAREGEQAEALFLVRSGFVKLSQKLGDGEIVVSYLSKGMTLGEAELLLEGEDNWIHTASSVENTELVKISRQDFNQLIQNYPDVQKLLWQSVVQRIREAGYSRRHVEQSEFIEVALNEGMVEGSSILVIDLNLCTRCDDCVRGCAKTHGGVPRFVREGEKYQNFLITRACYHCRDPVCLIGCPTGAIKRASVGEVVAISDPLCIGCSACATKCPYDAITMYETGDAWPDNAIPASNRGKPMSLASKCDLCYDLGHEPACVSNCPHGCAIRIGNIEEFQRLLANGNQDHVRQSDFEKMG
ncbi:MAG: cyclic nucleotide-binding domain-containing protein [bacterium]